MIWLLIGWAVLMILAMMFVYGATSKPSIPPPKEASTSEIRCQFCNAVLSVVNWEGEHKSWCPVIAPKEEDKE